MKGCLITFYPRAFQVLRAYITEINNHVLTNHYYHLFAVKGKKMKEKKKPREGLFQMNTIPIGFLRQLEMQEIQKGAPKYISSKKGTLLQKRICAEDVDGNAKPSTRLYFIEKLHQYLTDGSLTQTYNTEEAMKIGIVGEYCITLMYLDNHLQDRKYGVVDVASRCRNRLERANTEEALNRYIVTQFSSYTQERIIQTVEKLFFLYHKGMELDKYALTYEQFITDNPKDLHRLSSEIDKYVDVEAFLSIFSQYSSKKYMEIPKKNYLSLLLTRAYLINTVFFQVFVELMIDLYGKKDQDYSKLIEFARVFGLAQQLVNDNCDYLPVGYGYTTLCKLPEDTFSDLRRGLMTLPMMAFFMHEQAHKGEIFDVYAKHSSRLVLTEDNDQRWLLQLLKESGALGFSMSKVCTLANYGENLIKNEIFQDMFSFVRANRYYKAYMNFNYG